MGDGVGARLDKIQFVLIAGDGFIAEAVDFGFGVKIWIISENKIGRFSEFLDGRRGIAINTNGEFGVCGKIEKSKD